MRARRSPASSVVWVRSPVKTMKSGWFASRIHGGDGLLERVLGVGIGWALVTPMGVGELDEVEVGGLRRRWAVRGTAPRQRRRQPGRKASGIRDLVLRAAWRTSWPGWISEGAIPQPTGREGRYSRGNKIDGPPVLMSYGCMSEAPMPASAMAPVMLLAVVVPFGGPIVMKDPVASMRLPDPWREIRFDWPNSLSWSPLSGACCRRT